jgi:hypothetical protein
MMITTTGIINERGRPNARNKSGPRKTQASKLSANSGFSIQCTLAGPNPSPQYGQIMLDGWNMNGPIFLA